jgi:hypothetical protein
VHTPLLVAGSFNIYSYHYYKNIETTDKGRITKCLQKIIKKPVNLLEYPPLYCYSFVNQFSIYYPEGVIMTREAQFEAVLKDAYTRMHLYT